jgi:site-specific DNA recombinase
MNLLGFIMSLVYMQVVHGWLSAYERLVNSQNFFSPYLTQEDMSRLGRNYLQVGMYTEMIFPQKGVRFIAINDGVDSAQGDNDFAPLRNIFKNISHLGKVSNDFSLFGRF